MNNSVYGKTMKNLRKIVKVRLINNVKDYNKYVSKPSFVSQKIFSKNSVAIYQIKPVLKLDKSIYVGFIILNLSEFLIYKFHYKYTGTKYDNCAKMMFAKMKQMMFAKIFMKIKTCLILVVIQKIQNFLILPIKNVIGKLKDEVKEKIISDFVGLKSKMYSLVIVNDEKIKKQKESMKILLKT